MIPAPTIIRSKKRKRTVALHVEADGSVVVTAPVRTSLSWINAFIVEKGDWIARRRAAWQARKTAPAPELTDGCAIPFLGEELILTVVTDWELGHPPLAGGSKTPQRFRGGVIMLENSLETPPRNCLAISTLPQGEDDGIVATTKQHLHLSLPSNLPPDILQAEIKTELTLWYKKQARRVFQERLAHWAALIGVKPSRLVITNPKRRWGSCNGKNEIRLNWRLIMSSPEVLDYVIVHELCHIPHRNHGKRFWALVERFTPHAKNARQQLRNFEKAPFQSLFA